MGMTNDKLIRIEQVLSEIGIKKTNLYELIKLLKNAIDEENNQNKIDELNSIYTLIILFIYCILKQFY
jgi:hypothetical protein